MSLTRRTLETLTDLVENKLACMQVFDREDQREVVYLQRCLLELNQLSRLGVGGGVGGAVGGIAMGAPAGMQGEARRRGRPPKALALNAH